MIGRLRFILASSVLLALGACATTTTTPTAPPGPPPAKLSAADDNASVYGLYLAGEAARYSGDDQAAAHFFARASSSDQQTPLLRERAFTMTLLAGDVSAAAALAPQGADSTDGARALGLLVQSVEDLAAGRGPEAWARLSQPSGRVEDPSVPLLRPWAAAAVGRTKDSLATPGGGDRLLQLVASIDQALLFERAHRYAEAETGFRVLLSKPVGKTMIAPIYAQFLERRGRRREALAIFDDLLSAEPTNSVFLDSRARVLAKGAPPPAPSIREGAAQALMVPAAAALSERVPEEALIYLRLALRLDPRRDEAWLLVGDILSDSGDLAGARAAFGKIPLPSPRYADARSRLAWSYQQNDDKDTALKIARETVQQAPTSDAAKLTLADLQRVNDLFEDSAKTLDPVITAAGDHAEWRLYYMRAVALERSGHWPEAQRDLSKALSLRPDEPEVLNYLGYSWVNRGEHVKEGMALIQKAVAAEPQEGAYVDSLGWSYYRTGDFVRAVETLEQAVSLDAGDAEINDHLGDAYWRVGRKDEARFQWQAVLNMKPEPEVKARAEAKLASPLGVDAVAQPAPVASQAASAKTP